MDAGFAISSMRWRKKAPPMGLFAEYLAEAVRFALTSTCFLIYQGLIVAQPNHFVTPYGTPKRTVVL
jgi:hypothetical protein